MKKNVMMRVASVMLVLVLMTSSVISGTFAKYVTSGDSKDTARVAHFGVTVYGDSDIFDAQYEGDSTGWETKLTVKAKTADNLVAPGTTKTMANVDVVGIPEVAVRISNVVNKFDVGDNWMVDSDDDMVADKFYCPIIITVVDATSTTYHVSGLDFDNADDFEAEVKEKIQTATKDYEPLTNLETLGNDDVLEITWAWAFEGAADSSALSYGQTDEYDTQLGNAANKGTIEIDVTTYVTQID